MRDKFNQFMQGRYGNDDLNRFLMKIILAPLYECGTTLWTTNFYLSFSSWNSDLLSTSWTFVKRS